MNATSHRILLPLPLALVVTLCGAPAAAAPYPVHIDVDTAEDIDQLFFDGEIDEEERERLLTLFYTKIDLNLATREELYELPGFTYQLAEAVIAARERRGRFNRVSELAGVEGMTPVVFDQVRPFVSVLTVEEEARDYSGDVKSGVLYRTEQFGPSAYLRGRMRFLTHGRAGFLVSVVPKVGSVQDARELVTYTGTNSESGSQPTRHNGAMLSAAPTAPRFDPTGIYLAWDGPRLSIIGGSYRIGFGLGLTMDNTSRRLPHGWYPNVDYSTDLDTGKVRPYEGFMGLAARYKQLDLGGGWVDVTAFGSIWNRDVYYTDVFYDRCEGEKIQCSGPWPSLVDKDEGEYQIHSDGTTAVYHRSLSLEYPTYPYMLREAIGGANVTYWINRRSFVGFTGYGGYAEMRKEAAAIQPSTSSKFPTRRAFGSWGINTRFGIGRLDVGAEVAITDKVDTGAVGLLIKAWYSPIAHLEIEPSFRYYSPQFDNPYNRGEASADEFQGNRARDELGGRLRVDYRPIKMLRLRWDLDVWHHKYPGLSINRYGAGTSETVFSNTDEEAAALGISPATDLETRFNVQLRPTSKEWITAFVTFHDEDVSRNDRNLSYGYRDPRTLRKPTNPSSPNYQRDLAYYEKSLALPNVEDEQEIRWGGSKVTAGLKVTSSRIPYVSLSAMVKSAWEDVWRSDDTYDYDPAKNPFRDSFDHGWYVWLKATTNLDPGPRITARVKFLDEATLDDADWQRDETLLDVYLQARQKLHISAIPGSTVGLRFGYARWLDDRLAPSGQRSRWDPHTVTGEQVSRDEFLIKGDLLVKF